MNGKSTFDTHFLSFLNWFLFLVYFVSSCYQVDLRHNDEQNGTNIVEVGVDLTEFYQSVEWDILEVPAIR